jgi:uncharacterized protein (DUF1501 family)
VTDVSRRSFLRKMLLASESEAITDHTLICVFLRGGADTLNMLVPYGDDDYYKARPTIAIGTPNKSRSTSVLAIDSFYGLHPKMAALLKPYQDGRLAFVQGVGSDNVSGSHFDAQDQLEHGEAYGKTIGGGWLGRYLKTRTGHQQSALSAVSIGTSVPESLKGAPIATCLASLEETCLKVPASELQQVVQALSHLYGAEIGLLASAGKDALKLNSRLEKLKEKSTSSATHDGYPQTDFGKGLIELARLIKAGVGLEIATIDLGGWDTHFFQGADEGIHAANIFELSNGLAAFDKDLSAYQHKVTTVVITEFGRRPYENGSQGTDHGRAFSAFALGDGIAGGKVYGRWPGISHEPVDVFGPGGLKLVYDYRSLFSELLHGCLQAPRLDKVFPDFTSAEIGLAPGKQSLQTS